MKIVVKFLNALIVTCFILLVAIVFMQVFFRYILGNSLSWAEETAQFIFIWLIYLGGIIRVRKGINIAFDVFLDSLPYKIWRIAFTLVNIISISFLLLIIVLGFDLALVNMTQLSSIMRLPMGFVYLAIPVGAVGMLIAQVDWYMNMMKKRRAEAC